MKLATEDVHEEEAVRPASQGARLGGTDIFRGALVIITAIVIGGFVISRGLDEPATDDVTSAGTTIVDPAGADAGVGAGADDGSAEPAEESMVGDEVTPTSTEGIVANPDVGTSDETTVTSATDETAAEDTAMPAPAIRPPAEVRVLVLNGAQTQGIAARGTEALKAASYNTAAPKNATAQRPSAILFADGYQAEAGAVAEVFGVDIASLVMPLDPLDLPIEDTQGANVIVVIGADDLIPIP